MSAEKRVAGVRDECRITTHLVLPSAASRVPCLITDISERGAKLRVDASIELAPQFVLALPLMPEIPDHRHVELRWRRGRFAGVRFLPAEGRA